MALVFTVVSSVRGNNIGDIAMTDATIEFLHSQFPAAVIDVVGPSGVVYSNDKIRRSTPIASTVLPGLRQSKVLYESLMSRLPPSSVGPESVVVAGPAFVARLFIVAVLTLQFGLLYLANRMLRIRWSPIRGLESCDAVVSAGGGAIASVFPISLYETVFVMLVASLVFRVPIYLCGDQIGPLTYAIDRWAVSLVLNRASLVGLREKISVKNAQQLVRNRHVEICLSCDWAFRIGRHTAAPGAAKLRIAVNLRRAYYSTVSRIASSVIAEAINKVARGRDVHVVFCSICENANESDEAVANEIRSLLEDRCTSSFCTSKSAREVMDEIGACHAAIGTSYHFCLFALMQGLPVIGVSDGAYYAMKHEGLFGLFNVSEWSISGNQLAETGSSALAAWIVKSQDFKSQIAISSEQVHAQAHCFRVRLANLLSSQISKLGRKQ